MTAGDAALVATPELIVGPGFYFQGDDRIRITGWNSLASVVLSLTGRFLHLDGRIEAFAETLTPASNRTASTAVFQRAKGWLTDLAVIVTGATPQRGQTFVRVDVVRGMGSVDVVLSTLMQGYVTATQRLAYPGSPIESSLAGPGAIRSITGTDPAANTEVSETVPTGARWRFLSLLVTLVTDATAATREVALTADDGTNAHCRIPATQSQAASLTRRYTFTQATPLAGLNQDATIPAMFPALLLAAGHRLVTVTTARQATDNFGAPQYEVEEWLEPV
jgi:hypothetical protein